MKRLLDRAVRVALVVIAVVSAVPLFLRLAVFPPDNSLESVAHAGGGIDGTTYTNSIAALDMNYARNFRVFEIDFLRTADGRFICGHDWDSFGGARLRYVDFERLRGDRTNAPCTLDELFAWFEEHPDAVLLSDAKEDEVELNALLVARLGPRLIGQAYDFDQLCAYREAGVQRTILTLYRLPASVVALIRGMLHPCVGNEALVAVTMDPGRVGSGHAMVVKLLARGLPVYTHTINDCTTARVLTLLGADEVYTDFLPAIGCPPLWQPDSWQ